MGWRIDGHDSHPVTFSDDNIGAHKIETAVLQPDGAGVRPSHEGHRKMFADETAWVRAVEAYWRRETGERVLKVV